MWILDRGVRNWHLFQHIQPSSSSTDQTLSLNIFGEINYRYLNISISSYPLLFTHHIPDYSVLSHLLVHKIRKTPKNNHNPHGETYFQICLMCLLLMHHILRVYEILMELPIGITWYGCSVLTSESFSESHPTNILTSATIGDWWCDEHVSTDNCSAVLYWSLVYYCRRELLSKAWKQAPLVN